MSKVYFVGNSGLLESDLYQKSTIEECASWLNGLTEVNLDTETQGKFDHKNKILMLQLNWEDVSYIIDVRYVDISSLKPALESILVVGQNLKFDYKFMKFHGIEFNHIYDTLLAECCLTNGFEVRALGLQALANKYCNITLNKSVRNQFCEMNGEPFTEQQIMYGLGDVTCLTEIKTKQELELVKHGITAWAENEMNSCLALGDVEYNGMGFDEKAWLDLTLQAKFNEDSYYKLLDGLVRDEPKLSKFVKKRIQANLFYELDETFEHERDIDIKWSSPAQVDKVFKALGLNLESTSERFLTKYQNKYPLIKQFIDYKKQQKLVTTYGENFLNYVNPNTKRIHTSFWQIAETSRVTSGSKTDNTPNMQNIPAKKEYRNCFITRPGFVMVSCDFSGQELRLVAEGSREPVWVDAFNRGEDLHSNIASLVFKIPLDQVRDKPEKFRGKSYRDIAKIINFGYGK
jgi:DNA polymerase-1